MSYLIVPSYRYVFLVCEDDMTLAEITTAWREVQDALAGMRKKRVLVDVTALKSSLEIKELFDLAKILWRDFPESGRIALVIRWDQARFAKLLEMLVRTVGLYLTAFVSGDQAEAWILEEAKSMQPLEEFAK